MNPTTATVLDPLEIARQLARRLPRPLLNVTGRAVIPKQSVI